MKKINISVKWPILECNLLLSKGLIKSFQIFPVDLLGFTDNVFIVK